MDTSKLQVLKGKQLFEVELILKDRILLREGLASAIINEPKKSEELRANLKGNSEELIAKTQELEEEILTMYKEVSVNQIKATARIAELIKETYKDKEE